MRRAHSSAGAGMQAGGDAVARGKPWWVMGAGLAGPRMPTQVSGLSPKGNGKLEGFCFLMKNFKRTENWRK